MRAKLADNHGSLESRRRRSARGAASARRPARVRSPVSARPEPPAAELPEAPPGAGPGVGSGGRPPPAEPPWSLSDAMLATAAAAATVPAAGEGARPTPAIGTKPDGHGPEEPDCSEGTPQLSPPTRALAPAI